MQNYSTPISQEIDSKKPTGLLLPVLIAVLVSGIFFGTLGYFLGSQESTVSVNNDSTQQTAQQPTQPSPPDNNESVFVLPLGWEYKSNDKCNVQFPIPPKESPYYRPIAPDEYPSVTTSSGRFWDFPRGSVYPNMLALLPEWDYPNSHSQAAAWFATADEASGYVSQAIVVSCMENNGQFSNNDVLLTALEDASEQFNASTEEKGMRPTTITMGTVAEVTRWGYTVLDLTLDSVVEYPDYFEKEFYTMFVTSNYIYEVRVFGETEDAFVRETGQRIFDNLLFQD